MSAANRRSISLNFAVFARIVLALLFAAMLLVSTKPAQARLRARKLSGILPPGASIESYYFEYAISPDSQYVVYIVHGITSGSDDLYSVFIRGGEPTRLTLPGFNGRSIKYLEISPDSSRVVYIADADVDDQDELFSVPIDGSSPPLRISSIGMIDNGDVSDFRISPDAARVIYRADPAADGQFNLYSVPIGGGLRTRINDILAANIGVMNYWLTPDGQRVAYTTHNEDSLLDQLFFTRSDARDPHRLDSGPVEGMVIWNVVVLPDNSGVVYCAWQESALAADVYRADFYTPPAPPMTQRLTEAPDPSSLQGMLQVTPDGQYVVFAANYTVGGVTEYWRARTHPPAGFENVLRLHPALVDQSANMGYWITPNGVGAIFVIQEQGTGKHILYSNTIATPLDDPFQLSHTPTTNNTGVSYLFAITPNSLGVVFTSNVDDITTDRLYSNWITGGEPISLSPNLVAGGNVSGFQITPDSQFVIFEADGLTNNQDELFIVPIGGPWTSTQRLNSPITNASGDVVSYLISPDGEKVIYIADAVTDEQYELYVVEDVALQFVPLVSR